MHHGFQNTHSRIAKMHMMINENMIMFGASSLSMGGSISTPRPSTQPKQYHELKQYKKIKLENARCLQKNSGLKVQSFDL